MRRSIAVLTVGSLAAAGLVLPVVGVVTRGLAPVAPTTWSIALAGVDAVAAAARGALDPALDEAGAPRAPVERSGPSGDGRLVALTAPRSTDPFMVAGVTWDADEDVDVTQVALRLHEDGAWSPWTLVEVSDDVDDAELEAAGRVPRDGTEPLTSTGADGVQARVLTADGRVPAHLAVELVDPGEGSGDDALATLPLSTARAATATSSVLEPTVVTREQWGADESLASSWENYSNGLKALYVHHTAGTNSYTAAQAPQLVRGIYAYHTKAMRWPDIGYQYLVDKFGTVYQGRRDALTDLPVGAQAGGYNSQTIGVSALGNYSTAKPSAALVTAIEDVLAWKAYEYGLEPQGRTTLTTGTSSKSQTRYRDGQKVKVDVIQGHRDTNYTACPGTYLYAQLPQIRAAVAAKVEAARVTAGTAQDALPAPAMTTRPSPVIFTARARLAWRPVPGAVRYQVLSQPTSYRTAETRNQSWWLWTTVSGTSAAVKIAKGASRVLAVRAVNAGGRPGAATLVRYTGRGVALSALAASTGRKKAGGTKKQWKKRTGKAYVGKKALASTTKGASLRVASVRGVDRVVLRGVRKPKAGKLVVSLGGWSTTVALKAGKKNKAGKVVVKLGAARSGTLVLTKKDGRPTVVSSVGLGRPPVADPATLPSPPPAVVACSTAAPVLVTAPTADLAWQASPGAKKYWVYTRTPGGTGAAGEWRKLASTTGLSYRLTLPPDGGQVEVGVAAVVTKHARAAVSTQAVVGPAVAPAVTTG